MTSLRIGVLLIGGALCAQPQPQQPPQQQYPDPAYPAQAQPQYPPQPEQYPQQYPAQQQYPGQQDPYRTQQQPQYPQQPRAYQPPPSGDLTLPAGTVLSVRINHPIATNRNQPGDGFSATLQQPLVAGGYVVAQRGQQVLGRVTVSERAGQVKGTSRLGIELSQLTLVDGAQAPLHTELVEQRGGTSNGRDAMAIGTTTAMGAAIGGGVGEGTGAAIGAGAGAAAGIIGVLLTRGHDTVIYPETLLVFRTTQPITISTSQTASAFQPVGPNDYQQNGRPPLYRTAPGYDGSYPSYYVASPAPYYYAYPYPYPYYGYGYGWGPSFSFYYGYGYRGRRHW